jgi:hypothetical protein
MAMGPGNYVLAKSFPVENGVNRFLVRSTTQPGNITVHAAAEGLKPASLTLTTKPFVVENGLTRSLPSANLPSRLDRGPTPSTPSFSITRIPVNVTSATAGANADSTGKSYDDNELSDWVNDGNMNTAWIEYTLEREASISEITVKLNNFRSRVYPLRISVDDKEVFNGSTQTTLGYYTIKCRPQRGRKVRIQLANAATSKDNNTGTEVGGKKLDDGVERNDARSKGTLSIIEIEFYEAIPTSKQALLK